MTYGEDDRKEFKKTAQGRCFHLSSCTRKRGIDHPHLNAVMAQVVGSAALGTNSAVEDASGKWEKGAYTTALADAELERFSDIQNT